MKEMSFSGKTQLFLRLTETILLKLFKIKDTLMYHFKLVVDFHFRVSHFSGLQKKAR